MNKKHCGSLHSFHIFHKKPRPSLPNTPHHRKEEAASVITAASPQKGRGSFCHYCCFFGFFVCTFFFCPFFFFFMRTAFSPINAFLECPASLEVKLSLCLGLLTSFKLGFEFCCFSFSLLTERMTLSFLPISSELFNFKAR